MEDNNRSRRSFLNAVWVGIGGLALFEAAGVLFSFLRPRPSEPFEPGTDEIIVAGPVDGFEPGTVSAFVKGKFYLARLDDGGFLAMSRRCTHLSCTVPWVESDQQFICPCHSSAFDIRGEVIQPPAPRALDLYPVEIYQGNVLVDTRKTLKRASFAADQVRYPEST
jgi:cytochrome b6-f complex iron-sulfur subunit